MNYDENQFQSFGSGVVAEQAGVNERADFIQKTYLHLLGAVLLFCGLEVAFIQGGLAKSFFEMLQGTGQFAWLAVLGGFMVVSWVANSWALSATSVGKQYAGLGLYVVAEAILFAPLLYVAEKFGGEGVIPTAGLITLLTFGGLTAAVLITRHDFSFLRTGLMFGGFAAMAAILCAALMGFQLGNIFVIALIVLACGYILYYTSNVLHHYQIGQHVAAALALFSAVALLFWYVLQLVMSRD
jgi:FtsH-binding integral membrane protein